MFNNLVRMVEQLPINGVYILPKKPLMPCVAKTNKGDSTTDLANIQINFEKMTPPGKYFYSIIHTNIAFVGIFLLRLGNYPDAIKIRMITFASEKMENCPTQA